MKKHFLLLILSLLFLPLAQGKVKLPAMMGDHMVLQQNSSVKLWGWADGKKVTVTTSWNNRTYQASTDKDGAWLVKVDTPKGGYTPYSITISDGTPVTLSDILIGEVWICSGQSNMEMRMMGNAAQPIDNSLETLLNSGNYRDRIRFITVPRTNDTERRTDFEKRKASCRFGCRAGCRSGCRVKIPKALILRHFSLSDNHDNQYYKEKGNSKKIVSPDKEKRFSDVRCRNFVVRPFLVGLFSFKEEYRMTNIVNSTLPTPNNHSEKNKPDGVFVIKQGKTNYKVKVFFDHSSGLTAEDRLKRIIQAEAERESA